MFVRRFVLFALVLLSVWRPSPAQTICSGNVSGAHGQSLPLAHASLLTPDRASVVQTVKASDNGAFTLTIPHTGFWIFRLTGVAYADQDVVLYVPDAKPISVSVSLGCYRYLPGEPDLTVIGDFNLWSIPTAVPLKKTEAGTFSVDIPASTDSVTLRIRGYRDGDGVEGIRDAAYVLNRQGSYDARIKTSGGKAHVTVDPGLLDWTGSRAKLTFEKASEQTRTIAAAVQEWWDGEQAYFAEQMVVGMDRPRLDSSAPDWRVFTAKLLRAAKAEKEPLIRSVRNLASISTLLKSRHIDTAAVTACMKNVPATSPVWSLNPHMLSYAVRRTTWHTKAREKYLETALQQNPDRVVRLAVVYEEFMITFHADQEAIAARYYDILMNEYGDTEVAKDIRKNFPRPEPPAKKK